MSKVYAHGDIWGLGMGESGEGILGLNIPRPLFVREPPPWHAFEHSAQDEARAPAPDTWMI